MAAPTVQTASLRRWHYAAAAFVMQLCLGVIYAWSVVRGPLGPLYGWPKTATLAPYR